MNYSIKIYRQSPGKGKLWYSGSFSHVCDCWWDEVDKIPSGLYNGCSKTHLANKTNPSGNPREGIYIPNVPGRQGIFIHYWPGVGANVRAWSDGCTLVRNADMIRIWNDISPANAMNVSVEIFSPATTDLPSFLSGGIE